MKKTNFRILTLLLAVLMLSCMFVGCGKNKMTVTVGIKLGDDYITYRYNEEEAAGNDEFMIPAEDRVFLNDVSIEIPYEEGEQVSALDAFIDACKEYDIQYTLESNQKSVSVVSTYKGFLGKDDDGNNVTFFWTYTINGVEPTSGRAADNYVNDGDVIVFTLTSANESDYDENN